MAVIPMQKVQLLVHQSDTDRALAVVQRSRALELQDTSSAETLSPQMVFAYSNLLPRAEHVQQFLEQYTPKQGLLKSLREGNFTELTEEAVAKIISETDGLEAIVSDIERLQVEFAEKTEAIRSLEEQHNWLATWKNLPFKLSALDTNRTTTKLVASRQTKPELSLETKLNQVLTEAEISYAVTVVDDSHVAVTIPKETDLQKFQNAVDTAEADIVQALQATETPDVEFVAVSERLAGARGEQALALDQAEYFAKEHLNRLRVATEILNWARDRHAVLAKGQATARTARFVGWLDATKREQLESEFKTHNIAATFVDIEPADGEEPPVDVRNNKYIAPFEAVTRLYGMPGYKDLDPTVFLAGFFFLFFGLSLTDVGYGLSLMAVSAFILFYCKVTAGMRSIAWLLLYIGFATVLIGALFGGYLGIDPTLLPAPLQAIQLFDPIGDPLPVFYLALSLGVLQVMVGMVLKIYSEARNGKLLDGIFDQGPWLMLFSLGILYVGVATNYVSFITVEQIKNLSLIGVVMVLVAGARHSVPVVQRIVSSFANLYAGVGYFSDILSYSRLLALGLATSALAFAVNLIASMVAEIPYVGFILMVAILIVGHLFTLIINTLGAFVHSARLQFVEFFGKFIAGTGKDFAPLYRKQKYVSIKDD